MSALGLTDYPALALWQIALDGTVVAENLLGQDTGVGIIRYEGLGLPGQRTADQALPHDHGVVALGDFHAARSLVFELCITGAGDVAATRAADAWTQLRTLAGVWQARTADVVLELCMTDGSTYALSGRPRKFDADTAGLRLGVVSVAVEFVATDPRLYATTVETFSVVLDTATPAAGGLCLTDTPNGGGPAQVLCFTDTPNAGGPASVLCLSPRTAGLEAVNVRGNTPTYPYTTFFGPVTDPRIINETTNRTLSFVATVAASHTLAVDHKTRTVTLDGAPRPDLIGANADFWPLLPGLNNVRYLNSTSGATRSTGAYRVAWL